MLETHYLQLNSIAEIKWNKEWNDIARRQTQSSLTFKYVISNLG